MRALLAYGAALLAFIICVYHLLQPHALFGVVEYDDGVYVGAVVSFVDGKLPYRDFAFGHPPGIVLLLAPLAFLLQGSGTRTTFAAARLQTTFVAAANVFLLARLVRHRGPVAVLVSGVFLAVFPAAVFANTTVMLEPYAVLLCLLAASLLFCGDEVANRTRLAAAGVAFGCAGAVKVWALLPAAVAVACCLLELRKRVAPLVAGMAAGFGLLSIAFFSLAPSAFVRDVITVQLTRSPSPGALSVGERLVYLTGLPSYPSVGLAAAIAGVYAAIVVVAFAVGPRPSTLDWFALGAAVTAAAALLAAPDFGFHYAYFFAAFLALLLGLSCGRLTTEAVRAKWFAHVKARVPSRSARGLLVAIVSALTLTAAARTLTWHVSAYDPRAELEGVIPENACVITDQPAITLAADRFVGGGSHCPAVADPFLTWLVDDASSPPSARAKPSQRLVDLWSGWIASADYAVISADPFRIPWSALSTRFERRWHLVANDGLTVYRIGSR